MKQQKLRSGNKYKTEQKTERSRFTRMCIGEAIAELLENVPLEEMHICAICKKAGVSRMTFYYYYDSVSDALSDYTHEILHSYLDVREASSESEDFLEYKNLVFTFKFFDRYAAIFLTLTKNKLHSILLDSINEALLRYLPEDSRYSIYDVYYHAGGLLNTFVKWQENGKKESAEDIAKALCEQT